MVTVKKAVKKTTARKKKAPARKKTAAKKTTAARKKSTAKRATARKTTARKRTAKKTSAAASDGHSASLTPRVQAAHWLIAAPTGTRGSGGVVASFGAIRGEPAP